MMTSARLSGNVRLATFLPRGPSQLSRPSRAVARSTTRCSGRPLTARRLVTAVGRSMRIVRDGIQSMPANRPKAEDINVSAERTTHILDGEPGGGGGHRHGVGKPGKTEFPASWDDEKIMGHVLDVVRRPDSAPVVQHRNNRWICSGTRDGVEVTAIVLRSGEIWTAWPEEGGPGVRRNPKKE